MIKKMSKVQSALFLIALMLTNIVLLHDCVAVVIVNNLYEAFPGQEGAVNLILSAPGVIIIFTSLLAGKLLSKISYKKMLILGSVLFVFVSFFSTAVNNIYWLLAMRVVTAFAYGFVNVAAVALIAYIYPDENARSKMQGIYNGSMNIVGIAMNMVAGYAASIKWQLAFVAYWPSVIMLLLIIVAVPENMPGENQDTALDAKENIELLVANKERYGSKFWAFCLAYIVYVVLCIPLNFFSSVYVAENGIGNEIVTGMINTCFTIGGIFGCFGYVYIYKIFKRALMIPMCVLYVAAYFAMFYIRSAGMAYAMFVVIGLSFGAMTSFSFAIVPNLVPASRINSAMGIATSLFAIGSFVGTYWTTFLMNILHTNGMVTLIYPVCAVAFIVPVGMELIACIRERNHV